MPSVHKCLLLALLPAALLAAPLPAPLTLEEFRAQQTKLSELGRSSGTRAKDIITDAQAEVNGLHAELARSVSTGLGLGHGMRSVK